MNAEKAYKNALKRVQCTCDLYRWEDCRRCSKEIAKKKGLLQEELFKAEDFNNM